MGNIHLHWTILATAERAASHMTFLRNGTFAVAKLQGSSLNAN